MANLSRLTIDAELRAIAQLVGEAQQHRMLAARLTLNCIDGKPNRTVLKLAAEGAAARITAAQLPLFVTPDALHAGLVKLGIPADTATGVVANLAAAMAVRDEHEQVNDEQAAELVTSELVSVPSLAGLKTIRLSNPPQVDARGRPISNEPVPEQLTQAGILARAENPSSEDGYPALPTEAELDEAAAVRAGKAAYDELAAKQQGVTS